MICHNYKQFTFCQHRLQFMTHSQAHATGQDLMFCSFQTLGQELAGFVFWTQAHNAIASQMLQPILSLRGKGGQEHQFLQPPHTMETRAFCNSGHVAQSTKQVYNRDLSQNPHGSASKDMGLSEQSFPSQGHSKNVNK